MIPKGEQKRCCECGRKGVMLLKRRNENGERVLKCVDCCAPKVEEETNEQTVEKGDYIVKWKLQNEDGKRWVEEMHYMTLADFEVAYGNIIHDIIWIQMRKRNEAII